MKLITLLIAVLMLGLAPAFAEEHPDQKKPIKIGITVSKQTAEGVSPGGQKWGYDKQVRIATELKSPDFELTPIIEPGSAEVPEQDAILKRVFADRDPIKGDDVEALKTLDVIVTHEYWVVPIPVLEAFEKAVSGGVHLINIGGMGWASPGLKNDNVLQPIRLAGLKEGQGGFSPTGELRCDVLQNHPILGKIGQMESITLNPLGAYGILPENATRLVQVPDIDAIKPRGPTGNDMNYTFYPIYISNLEKGKIVGLIFSPYKLPGDLRSALLQRSVRWVMGRNAE